VAGIMALGAIFAAMNTMYAAVSARTTEIGTLRALGFRPAAILTSFLFESLVLALAAGLVGVVLALPINLVSTSFNAGITAPTLAGAGYAPYQRPLGRPPAVETVMVTFRRTDQPGVLLTGSGYVVTRHKYIIIGTKILGQIVEEPIEEGQHVKRGDLLARIDDRDYLAQLPQAIADRELAEANLQLARAKAAREHELYASGIISKDEFETFDNAAKVAEATVKRNEAAIDYAKFQVSQCVIVSPIDGVVLQKY